jgi:hypothetical protein
MVNTKLLYTGVWKMSEALEQAIDQLKNFEQTTNFEDIDDVKRTKDYLEWVTLNSEYASDRDIYVVPADKREFVKRGKVVWVNFGFNVGREFSGKHPALILKVQNYESMYVLPLDSGDVPEDKKDKSYCIPIPFVFDFPSIKRWCNVYRIVCLSCRRIDFNSRIGRIRGTILDTINTAIDGCGLKGNLVNHEING